jgi:aspartate kinase
MRAEGGHRGFNLDADTVAVPAVGVRQPAGSRPTVGQDELLKEVVGRLSHMEDIVVSEVQLDDSQARITIDNLPDRPGVCAHLFAAVAEGDVMVDMIVQNVSDAGRSQVSFTVPRHDLQQCLLLVREVMSAWAGTELSYETEIAKLTVMGIGLRTHTGVGDKMFRALAAEEINVQMINTSEIRLSIVVARDRGGAHACLADVGS